MMKSYSPKSGLFIKLLALIFAAYGTVGASFAQSDVLISVSFKGVPLNTALKQIEQKGNVSLLYNYDEVSKVKSVTFEASNAKLSYVLDNILKDTGMTYRISENTVIIGKSSQQTPIGSRKITGRIVCDETGNPLPGVTVVLKGTKIGVASDASGHYSLMIPTGSTVLTFSYLGYYELENPVDSEEVLNVELKRRATRMDDIIVETGYQRLNMRETASSATYIKMDDIELGAMNSVEDMLQGQAAGVRVSITDGQVGSTPTIRVRGTSTLLGNKAPLWVLDGIILEDLVQVDVSDINSPDAPYLIGNAIGGVNPRDIESITILKDAPATSLYGSRAANGVIVVTTKMGKIGENKLSYSTNLSMKRRTHYDDLNLMNAGERIQLTQEILADNIRYARNPSSYGYEGLLLDYYNSRISYDEFVAETNKMAKTNTDWYDILFRNSFSQNHTLSLSGGANTTRYYISLGYYNELGTDRMNSGERFTINAKVNSQLSKRLFIEYYIKADSGTTKGAHSSTNANLYAYETSRTIPCYNDDGSLYYYDTQQKSQTGILSAPKEEMMYNILNEMKLTGTSASTSSVVSKLNLQYNIFPTFRYRVTGTLVHSNANSKSWAKEASNYVSMIRRWNAGTLVIDSDDYNASVIPVGGILYNLDREGNTYTLRNELEYSELLGDSHMVSASVIQEVSSNKYKGLSGTSYGWQPDRGNTIAPAITDGYVSALGSLRPTVTDNVSNTVSWLGTVTYSYKNKLAFNFNTRMDGSNNFGNNPEYRFLPVWSVAGKYTLTNEEFLANDKVLRYLAVKGSFGLSGNVDKATSPDLVIQVGSQNQYSGLNESYIAYLPNPNLRWEETDTFNLGVEFSLFKSRLMYAPYDILSGVIEVYSKKSHAIITHQNVSQVIGMNQVKINGGRMNNKGFEASVRIVPYQSRDIDVTLSLIYSYNKNTLVEANKDVGITNDTKLAGTALIEGQPIHTIYSYDFAGLNPDWGFPMFYNKYEEKRYTLYADETELVRSGSIDPTTDGGFSLSFRYKNFRMNAGFVYELGAVKRLPNIYRSNYYYAFDATSNVSKDFKNRWRKPGDEKNTNIPVIYDSVKFRLAEAELNLPGNLTGTSKTPLEMYDRSTARVASTDNLTMRNLSFSYYIHERTLKQYSLSGLSLSFEILNLFHVAGKEWGGMHPTNGDGKSPVPVQYSFGINMSF